MVGYRGNPRDEDLEGDLLREPWGVTIVTDNELGQAFESWTPWEQVG